MGSALRPDRQRLRRDALRELDRARRRVPLRLLRAARRDGPGRAVPAPLVARRRPRLHRARLPLRLHLSVSDPDGAARAHRPAGGRTRVRDEAGDRPDSTPRRGRDRLHERAERLRRRLRPQQADRLLEHAARRQLLGRRGEDGARARGRPPLEQPPLRGRRLVRALRAARSVADRARHTPPRRDGEPGRGAAFAARRRGAQPALAARLQRDLAPHGAGGGLESARDHASPGAGEEPLPGVHDPVAERPRPAEVVVPPLRQPPVRPGADRDGRRALDAVGASAPSNRSVY